MEQIKTRLISTVYQVSLQITPALNRFCLVSPILASLSDDFCKLQGISTKYRTLHYQLTGDNHEFQKTQKLWSNWWNSLRLGLLRSMTLFLKLFQRRFYHLCLQQKLLIIPALDMLFIKILFLIDSMEIYLFGLQCRNIIWNPLKQTTRWLKKIWPQSCTVAWGEKSTNKILDNSTKTTRAQFRRSSCKLWIFCGTKSTIF